MFFAKSNQVKQAVKLTVLKGFGNAKRKLASFSVTVARFLAELTLMLVADRCRNLVLFRAGVDIQGGIQNEQC